MVVCVNCGLKVPTLYHVYNKTSFCLSTCVHCGKISDKYVEWELPLMIIDFFLFKVEVYRHLIHNYRSSPFSKKYRMGSRASNNLIKVVLLLFSATILDSYSLLTTSTYLSKPSDFCYPEFESYNKSSLEVVSSYFTPKVNKSTRPFKFRFNGVDTSLNKEHNVSVTQFVENMAKTMLYHSRLKVFKRRGLNDEYCSRSYNKLSELLFVLFLQNPTLCRLGNKTFRGLDELSNELGVVSLSFLRVVSYCLYIALFNAFLRKFGKNKNRNSLKSHEECKCNSKELHNFQISYTDIVFSLLLCFHIKALVLMMNIWYPRHTILIVIEFYIHLSHILELNSICNISMALSCIIVTTGAMVKLGVYFPWLYLMNHFDLF